MFNMDEQGVYNLDKYDKGKRGEGGGWEGDFSSLWGESRCMVTNIGYSGVVIKGGVSV